MNVIIMEKITSIQWLSKDERKLLRVYFHHIQRLMKEYSRPFDDELSYSLPTLIRAFRARSSKRGAVRHLTQVFEWYLHEQHVESPKINIPEREYVNLGQRLISLSHSLQKYKLIDTDLSKEQLDFSFVPHRGLCFSVRFTTDGYKLAEQYSSLWQCVRLWYNAYIKDHPVIIVLLFIIAYILGILSEVIVGWLTKEPAQ